MIKSVRIVWNEHTEEHKEEFNDLIETFDLQSELKAQGFQYEIHLLSDKEDEYNGFNLLPNVWSRVG